MEMATFSSDDGGRKVQDLANPTHVKVVVRIRPSSHNDASIPPRFLRTVLKPASDAEVKLDVDPALLAGHGIGGAAGPSGSKKAPSFSYDRVLPEDSTQLQVYEATALSAVDKFINGFNVTILAYGQTSSGKSYSMGTTGVETDYSTSPTTPMSSPSSRDRSSRVGIIPRAVSDIFDKAEQVRKASGPGASFEAKLSFLELYNEDLIDLLGPSNGPQVQIREDREGRIIWSGLKEVKVKNTSEVMHYLKEGSARRRTGETGMNATSSRSHAIFSLSLVQRRKANLTPSPRTPSTPSTPGKGGIPRPASTTGLPRSVTPSGTRSQTPSSFTPAKSGLMRPASMYGGRPGSPAVVSHHVPDEDDEWVTTTGKFNMVDLAGSERLKRTAAQGERMKEGIAINSGLLALGNVISALGDPAKARTTTYIPYRDSKLTRLLQDSLGGNAYTVMIACVSPIEYNAGETLNTLKYAARARNIKNAAKANQVEAGWDDVEHLQSTVLRLRKELGTLKTAVEESGTNVKNLNAITEESQGQSTKASQRFNDMMREHDELNRQLLEKSGEIARLTGELQTSRAGATGASGSFHDDVAPIIGEYEKAIASFEARIQTLQSNLAVSNAERDEQEELLEELDTRQVQQEAYIAELKARVSRLAEREASHETYIHDLELKLKTFAEKEESTSDAVADLRKEIARHKEAEAEIALYVAELERRLSKSDAETSDLRSKVENFENELQRRDETYRELESRMALLDTSTESKQLLSELEVKDQKVADLERMLQDALQTREQVGADLDKLTQASQLDKTTREDLDRQIKELQANQDKGRPTLATMRTMSTGDVFMTPSIEISQLSLPVAPPTTVDGQDVGNGESTPVPNPGEPDATDLAGQVQELQSRQAATLQELEQVSSRYRDALREISDLATQLKEAKLEHAELTDVLPSPSLNVPEDETEAGTPSPGASPRASPRKRNLQRHTSTGSLYELGNRRDFQNGRGSSEPNRVRPQSLSQELSSAALSPSSHSSWADSTSRLSPVSRNRASMPPSLRPQRSVQSLEQEVMSLQKAIKDREVEIKHLETSLQNSRGIPSRRNSASALPLQELFIPQPGTPLPSAIPLPPSPTTSFTKSHRSSPVTPSRAQLSAHRRALSVDDDATLNQSEIDRLNELMRSMAQKESAHKEHMEKLQAQLVRTERKHVELQTLARDQALNMSAELDALRAQLASAGDDRATLAADAHATALERHTSQHQASLARLQETHQAELSELLADAERSANEAQKVAASALHALQEELANTTSQHEVQVERLRSGHAEKLQEADRLAAQRLEEDLRRAAVNHAKLLTEAAEEHSRKLDAMRVEHQNALKTLQKEQDSLRQSNTTLSKELAEAQQAVRDIDNSRQAEAKRAEEAEAGLAETLEAVQSLEQALQESDAERGSYKKELSQLRFELSTSRDAYATVVQASSKRDALVADLEKRLAESNAARKAAEAQLTANVTPPAASRFSLGRTSPNGSQVKHPPPIAPPPSMPPPPVPTTAPSQTSWVENADASSPPTEMKLLGQVEESEKIIATLNKQLSHCEADLQANIDMVNTLESALNDSERNLRKARLQTTEMARERDALTAQTDALRQQLRTAEQEVQNARNSVTTERQGLEKRLQEEQIAKERARAQLEARVTAMQNKQSKFQCF